MDSKQFRHVKCNEVFDFMSLVSYLDGGVQSRALVQRDQFSVTVFSFDTDEGISEYEMQGETWLILNEGHVQVQIEDKNYELKSGDSIAVPFGAMLGVEALSKAKMTMIILKP
jgi:quercetin dioxygenase-like cupin family protein